MAGLPIIPADERLQSHTAVKGQVWGGYGKGKTWLARTLLDSTTLAPGVLVLDAEAGLLSIQDVPVDIVSLRSWTDARDLACFFGGANPAFRDDQPYSEAHHRRVVERFGDPKVLQRYGTVFIDSISVVSKLCLNWAKGQPQAVSERTGKPDLRGAYGLLAQELIGWVTHWQHIPGLNVWLVGGLEERTDDFNRRFFAPQIDGAKTGSELPGIVDEVITMAEMPAADGKPFRAFVCQTLNDWGFPAKDRSGRLDMIEEPHLGRLMAKIRGPVKPAHERMEFGRPASRDADAPQPSQA